ncbi:kinetochore-associated protein NSL1 homolog [Lampris incognitus]|uniref:kinetochore-associated protein NSL1 homolog n=1 Tax=Lampris incognitus TaxID=2546036 RepID=UPI0024B58A82|nr:kinetochore-associated protein NSL1 homolog [Lampris incognitus]XP_056150656.1 kinetochore-associated protein NSL1 homolog [Lampris incognitus]
MSSDETSEEFRVNVMTKKAVVQQTAKYREVLESVLEDQPGISDESKRAYLKELQANFEALVQDNLLVNGQSWEEAPDDEDDSVLALECLLDDTIVETTRRRRQCPREILPHLVHALKAERKLMGLYEQAAKPQEAVKHPCQVSVVNSVSAAAPGMVKEAIQIMKSIHAIQKQAEGIRQVLNTGPKQGCSLDMYREALGCDSLLNAPLPPSNAASRSKGSIKTVVEEEETGNCYVPASEQTNRPAVIAEHQ